MSFFLNNVNAFKIKTAIKLTTKNNTELLIFIFILKNNSNYFSFLFPFFQYLSEGNKIVCLIITSFCK